MTTETTSPEWEDIMKIDKKITALGFGMACILWRYIFTCLLISDLDSIQKIFSSSSYSVTHPQNIFRFGWRGPEVKRHH